MTDSSGSVAPTGSPAAEPRIDAERLVASNAVIDAEVSSSPVRSGVLHVDPGALVTDYVYTFTLESFRITDTRSLHEDTDFVSIAVAVGSNPPITAPTKSMGNVNNGVHQVNLSIANVEVGQGENVAFSYAIVNSGHSTDEVDQALGPIVAAAAGKAVGLIGGSIAGPIGSWIGDAAGSWLGKYLGSFLLPDCDGSVAAGDHALSGATLIEQAIGATITQIDDNEGSSSPSLCNSSNSRYYVTWSITGQRKPISLAKP